MNKADDRARQGGEPRRVSPRDLRPLLPKHASRSPVDAEEVFAAIESQGADGPWQKPDPFEICSSEGRLAAAPLWALPTSFRRQLTKVSQSKQVALDAVFATLLGLLSAICAGRYCAWIIPQYKSHAHLWVLLSLPSAGGKSEAVSVYARAVLRAQRAIQKQIQELNDRNASERINYEKQIAAMESGSPEDYPGQLNEARENLKVVALKPLPRFMRKDVSPQKIGVLYAKYQIVCVVMTESADWIALIMGYGKDHGPTLTSCLSGHTVEPFGEDRITREESFCNRPVLSAFLACQEGDVREAISDPVARRRGFWGRTLVIACQSTLGKRLAYDQRPVITEQDMAPWEHVVKTVTEEQPESDEDGWVPSEIPVTEEATTLYSRLFEVIEKRLAQDSPDIRLDEIEDIAGRSMEQVGRLAILLHTLWTAPRGVKPTAEAISEATVFRAFAVMLWSLQGFLDLAAAGPLAGHQTTLKLWEDLDQSLLTGKGYCTLKDWLRLGPYRWRSSAKTEPQLAILEQLGYLTLSSRKNIRGPASRVIELNPLARHKAPATVAKVATVLENPLFIEVISAHPHLRRYVEECVDVVSGISSQEDENRRNDPCADMQPISSVVSVNGATGAVVAEIPDMF